MESGKLLKKRSSKGVRKMKVVINGKEREVADRESGRRIKMLDLEMRVLVSMERITHGRLFAARSKELHNGEESEEEWLDIMRAEENND